MKTKKMYEMFVSPFTQQHEKVVCKIICPTDMTNREIQARLIEEKGNRSGYGDTPSFNFALIPAKELPTWARFNGTSDIEEFDFTA